MSEDKELALVLQQCGELQAVAYWTRITKGYSGDRLYRSGAGVTPSLLRIFDVGQYEAKRAEFEMLGRLRVLGIRCSAPLKLEQLEEQGIGYMWLSYLEGEDASEALPQLSIDAQYTAGLEAGRELRRMHELEAPAGWSDWQEVKTAKHHRYVRQYRECGVRLPGDEDVLAFAERHLGAMQGRPNLFQHDDYHPSNLILQEGHFAGVIDIGRFDWGDPVHEFLKVGMFTVEISIPFAVGQIRGYHDGRDPDEAFWELYALYMAMAIISSVVWVVSFHPQELDEMMERLNRVMDDHRNFELNQPSWYSDVP
ncbi:aminoglycoside phosphotransferase family protein [Paenibacillus daejeonensis]|uniref:aminoglycoside phosphotransferase family protein n=1 Tax=Paenibacillus daejeonensis TaxID=135193 RepID=UPI00037D43AF|nr:aminoglycoside phosphotransferase family protein [Paenibacillus daejeonensis]